MRILSICLALILVSICGQASAQTSVVSVGTVTGELSPGRLDAGQPVTMRINLDGTGQTGLQPPDGPPFTHGNWIFTHGFIFHGDADWGGIVNQRLTLAQRALVEAGPMTFSTGIINRWWYKQGGTGDPDFGSPGTANPETPGTTFSGPTTGNLTGTDTVGILVGLIAISAEDGWNPDINPTGPFYEFQFSTLLADHGKFICLDTISQPLASWEWSSGLELVTPSWDNGLGNDATRCWEVIDPNAPDPSNLLLSEDTLFFAATLGDPNPPSQTFDITSDNAPLSFTLTENASWLFKTPSAGSTPSTISVSVNLTGLSPGIQFDSIEVASPGADNSPQFVFVRLDLAQPPPEIGVSSTSFLFNALTGGANPPDQSLIISNAGQSTLNWTVSNSQSWLQLNPASGSDSGNVTLSIDITGLGFGDFFDVITVSDPTATNDPVLVDVQLSIASDLPLIEVDSTQLFFPHDIDDGGQTSRTFEVRNGGGGALAFTAIAKGKIIDSIVPASATAPESLTVYFGFLQLGPDVIERDTVIITSASAVNSPLEVEIVQKRVLDPAVIALSDDTVSFDVFECSQGYQVGLPSTSFAVSNVGGDNPMVVTAHGLSQFFIPPEPFPQVAPFVYNLNSREVGLPLGTYYDTVTIVSDFALNSPQQVIVKYNLIAGTDTPEIVVEPDETITVAWQEESGPTIVPGVEVFNTFGGCMPWQIAETEIWFDVQTTSGDVPGMTDLFVNPTGFTLGEYNSAFLINAAGASNSPKLVNLLLQVWRFRGDLNWNGRITIQDAALLVDYLLDGGAEPQPVLDVADTNCDGLYNIADVITLTESLFITLTPICTNP